MNVLYNCVPFEGPYPNRPNTKLILTSVSVSNEGNHVPLDVVSHRQITQDTKDLYVNIHITENIDIART